MKRTTQAVFQTPRSIAEVVILMFCHFPKRDIHQTYRKDQSVSHPAKRSTGLPLEL